MWLPIWKGPLRSLALLIAMAWSNRRLLRPARASAAASWGKQHISELAMYLQAHTLPYKGKPPHRVTLLLD